MKIPTERHQRDIGLIGGMKTERSYWWPHWREIATYVLPRRYRWLESEKESISKAAKNPNILDGTGTMAARVLAAGLMNGITSPGRPWFRLRIPGMMEEAGSPERVWLDEVQRRMLLVMAESNFYNGLAMLYLDLSVFGTAVMLIYEDAENVIRCFNPCLGEYYLGQDARLQVNMFAREFNYRTHQVVEQWGTENVSPAVKAAHTSGGAQMLTPHKITHLIQPNDGRLPARFPFIETYWEAGAPSGDVLGEYGYYEFPGIAARWELNGNEPYGMSPAMDALGDIIQLQHETKRKGQSLDKMVNPPMVADIQLKHRPTALLPGGMTYVAGVNNIGVKPAYTVNPPLGELTLDIREVQGRIRETFHNDLFQMISQLDTVRSATEIDARREEKLIRLGGVLERFENEALDPAIRRIFSVMQRANLIPEPPESLQGADIEVQYVSILSTAQNAIAAAPLERLLGVVGNISPIKPEVLDVVNWEEAIPGYAADIGVRAKDINGPERLRQLAAERQQLIAAREAAATGEALVNAGKTLSETEVGGGQNALARLMGA